MYRLAEESLSKWRYKVKFKPLILMGARQVGKTWLMKNLAEKYFQNHIYINFEKDQAFKNLFEKDLNIGNIVDTLGLMHQEKIIDGKTLIIFDEIQEAKNALTSLKYFAEDRPNLHIIAAGSLLGVALDPGSFPVGKVELSHIHPMNFEEFLLATDKTSLNELLKKGNVEIISTFKERFIKALRTYYMVGGMPEAVSTFTQKNANFSEIKEVQNAILSAYMQDFAKHAPAALIPKIMSVWESMVSQLARENKKFIYGLVKTGARAREYELAIEWLIQYGLIHRIYAVNKIAFPLKAYKDLKSFKLYISDVGLLSQMANLSPNIVINNNSFFQEFKGALTEQFVQQELISLGVRDLNYWTNDNGMAELDFIFEKDGVMYPLEVKATENLQSKSLKVFHEKHPAIQCYRTSLSDFRDEGWMRNIPLYALKTLVL
jgi:uncharacterized protein